MIRYVLPGALGLAATTAMAVVPPYTEYELQARANFPNGFNLPAGSSFSSGTPALNDDATIAFRLIVVGGTGNAGLFVGANGDGGVVYEAPADRLLEDPSINSAGVVAFDQFDLFSDGVFTYTPGSGTALAVPANGAIPFNNVTNAQINDAGVIGFRASDFGGNFYVAADGAAQTEYVRETTSPFGFLFTASFNDANQLAGKVRVGGTAGSLPDELRVFEADGSSVVLAVDDDGDPASPYTSFDNSIDLTDAGRIAFIAGLVGGGRGVFLTDGTTTTTIATTNDPALSVIDFFPPRANEDGLVAFRGRDGTGRYAVYAGDGTALRIVVAEGDEVASDLGLAQVGQQDGSVPFGGSVAINGRGDVAFNAALAPADDLSIEWGSGMYVAYAGIVGDVNGDGDVNFADLLIVLSEWAGSDPAADVNGDGIVDFQDLLLVLSSWTG